MLPHTSVRAEGGSACGLHGKNFDGGAWEPTARTLSSQGYRVIVPDQIGFGRSGKPSVDYSFRMLAQNTVALLDHLGVRRTHVVGHSMGGMLATRFALDHPDRTGRLVLANPVGLEDYRVLVPPRPPFPVPGWSSCPESDTCRVWRRPTASTANCGAFWRGEGGFSGCRPGFCRTHTALTQCDQ
ncbi:alpha/beta hydrolase [Streptomyces sp. ODS28]|uniref:alpha/beta fold hydrolase n=1 Tax=Streptomyces sp. ODS28 TaxID=3136688 RepID=UPI0031EA6E4C